MKYWSLSLHFYQPPTQEDSITWNILTFCYLPLLRMLDSKSGYGITININPCLVDQIRKLKSTEFFELIDRLVRDGKVELLNSARYHPLIPLIPKEVLIRQIQTDYKTPGFFPSELAIDENTLDFLPYTYVFIDETSLNQYFPLVKYKNKYLLVNKRNVCELLRGYQGLLKAQMVANLLSEGLNVTVSDAEVFGHHYTERLQVLADLLDLPDIKFLTASQAIAQFGSQAPEVASIKPSTWQNCDKFDLWNRNALQQEYLQLLELNPDVDVAFSSCYLYWLSNWPWWHPGLVESGVNSMPKSKQTADFLKHLWDYHTSGQVEANYSAFDKSVKDRL